MAELTGSECNFYSDPAMYHAAPSQQWYTKVLDEIRKLNSSMAGMRK